MSGQGCMSEKNSFSRMDDSVLFNYSMREYAVVMEINNVIKGFSVLFISCNIYIYNIF